MSARLSESLAAVMAALQLQGASTDPLLALGNAGWQTALKECERLKLILPVGQVKCEGFPDWVRERLAENLADSARRFARVKMTYREAANVLNEAGIPHLVLKGFTQWPDFVTSPQLRMQGDIDFYTPRETARAAFDALRAIGYEPAGPPEQYRHADHLPTLIRFRGWKWRGNLFDPEMPLAIEVHTCLWNPEVSLISLAEVEQFWERRVIRRLDVLSFLALDPIDHLAYFALHLLRDVFRGESVAHHALELATCLQGRAQHSAFWLEWERRYSPQLKRVQAIAFALAGASFSSRLHGVVDAEIERLPAEQRIWIERCGGDIITESFRRTRDGRLLQLQLLDSTSARRTVLWTAMGPGVVPSPVKFASRLKHPVAPQISRRKQLWAYPTYIVSRIWLNGTAVLRFIANGMAVFFLSVRMRRESPYQ